MALPRVPSKLGVADTRRVKPEPKRADAFYLSAEWRRFIAQIILERRPGLLRKQGHLCEDPECTAVHSPTTRIFGDHIVELRDGGAPLDPANIMLRCGSSHTRKTLRERAKRLGLAP